jgi:hypothetical protein
MRRRRSAGDGDAARAARCRVRPLTSGYRPVLGFAFGNEPASEASGTGGVPPAFGIGAADGWPDEPFMPRSVGDVIGCDEDPLMPRSVGDVVCDDEPPLVTSFDGEGGLVPAADGLLCPL